MTKFIKLAAHGKPSTKLPCEGLLSRFLICPKKKTEHYVLCMKLNDASFHGEFHFIHIHMLIFQKKSNFSIFQKFFNFHEKHVISFKISFNIYLCVYFLEKSTFLFLEDFLKFHEKVTSRTNLCINLSHVKFHSQELSLAPIDTSEHDLVAKIGFRKS